MKPGTRVICISRHFCPHQRKVVKAFPFEGIIYVVRDLVPVRGSAKFHITLEGVENPLCWMPGEKGMLLKEVGFEPHKFVPVEEDKIADWKKNRVSFYLTTDN